MLSDLWNRLVAWTGTLVSPDWGALVALIPILLLLVVIAFIAITAVKWANAGPRRNGAGRKTPLGPDGIPLRGPSAAPFILAIGAFVLAFGLVAGGPWLPAGIAIALVGLVWLTIEHRRDTSRPEHTPGEATAEAGAEGDLARRSRKSRPAALALAWSLLLLGVGLVMGGIVLPLGIAAAVIAGVWWGWDVLAARTTPSPSPSAPSRRSPVTPARAVIVIAVLLVVIGIAATSKVVPETPASSIPPVPSDAFEPTLPPADVVLEAYGVTFTQTALTAPAGKPFTVAFDNRDKVPHNLEIRDAAGKSLFMGDIVTGPVVVVYTVPALAAGQYPFVCTVHPGMTGTLTVK